MWRLVCCLPLVAACSFTIPFAPSADAGDDIDAPADSDAAPPGSWLDGYTARKQITITSGATTELTDFPVALIITDDVQLAATARPDGSDLVITAADAMTPLAFEIESYANGSLAAWVRIPALTASATVFVYYGGPSTNRQDVPGTWATKFRSVWHLTDPVLAMARDSTSHGHHLAPTTMARQPATAVGQLAGARSFDGTDDNLQIADTPQLDFGTASFGYSFWIYTTQSVNTYDLVLYKGGGYAANTGYDFEVGTDGWYSFLDDGTREMRGTIGATDTAFFGRWVHLAVVIDRAAGETRAYVDGVFRDTRSVATITSVTNSAAFELSRIGWPFRGRLDEVRIVGEALTADWIATEYRNLASPTTFITTGSEQLRGPIARN